MKRVYGLGSVFGKSLHDARWSMLGVGLLIGGVFAVTASQVGLQFNTVAQRQELAAQMAMLPAIFHGLLGAPVNIETLPGFISWRLMGVLPVMVGVWSIAALSATLAGEASRGTLELVLSMPISRLSLAAQKLAAHLVALTIALLMAGLIAWLSSVAFAVLPGDEMDLPTALAGFSPAWAISLLAGVLAFALGPLLGRGLAAGAAAVFLFGSYIVDGYGDMVPGFDVLRAGSLFSWTAGHRPMAGLYDWPPVVAIAGLAVVLAVVGAVLFARRDLAAFLALPLPRRLGSGGANLGSWTLAGSGRRSFGERLPAALGWGGAMGAYGLFIALAADDFARSLQGVPQIVAMIRQFYPDLDLSSGAGMLGLVVFAFMPLVGGLAAATLVSGWSSDERDGRLELVLASPLRRTEWAIRSGGGVLLAVLLVGAAVGVLMAVGAAIAGDPAAPVFVGGPVIGLYSAGLAGLGLLVGGIGRPGWAGLTVGVLALGFYLLDLLANLLGLPDWVVDLSLTRHLGQPMAGNWDVGGLLLCAGLAVGGLIVGALGFARRDLRAE